MADVKDAETPGVDLKADPRFAKYMQKVMGLENGNDRVELTAEHIRAANAYKVAIGEELKARFKAGEDPADSMDAMLHTVTGKNNHAAMVFDPVARNARVGHEQGVYLIGDRDATEPPEPHVGAQENRYNRSESVFSRDRAGITCAGRYIDTRIQNMMATYSNRPDGILRYKRDEDLIARRGEMYAYNNWAKKAGEPLSVDGESLISLEETPGYRWVVRNANKTFESAPVERKFANVPADDDETPDKDDQFGE